jgi:general secretion pathway protein M
MSDALSPIWGERTERERAVIAFALILLALVLAYAYVWLPLTHERDRLLMRVPELRSEAAAMERDARELKKMRTAAPAAVGVRAAIQDASAAIRLPDGALEIVQQDPTRIRVAIGSARSEHAFTWVARLQSTAGIRIEQIRVTSLGEGGRVRVQAVVVSAR